MAASQVLVRRARAADVAGRLPRCQPRRCPGKAREARRNVAAGIDPGEQRKAEAAALIETAENSFEAVAREWFEMFSKQWAKGHSDKIIRRLELYIFP